MSANKLERAVRSMPFCSCPEYFHVNVPAMFGCPYYTQVLSFTVGLGILWSKGFLTQRDYFVIVG